MTKRPNREKLYDLAAERGGFFTTPEAHGVGFSTQLLAYHLRRGHFLRSARGVYRLAQFPRSPFDDIISAWLATGGQKATVSHESALAVHRLGGVNPRHVHLTLPRSARYHASRTPRHVKVHTSNRVPLKAKDIVRRTGVPVVRAVRAIVESAAYGSALDMIDTAVQEALSQGLTSKRELLATAHSFGMRVERRIRAAISSIDDR